MTTPPPPWEAHPPLPEDEFGDVDRIPDADPLDDADEATGPIRVLPLDEATTVIRTDRGLQEAADATLFAETGSADTVMAEDLGYVGGGSASLDQQETAFARIPVDDRTQYRQREESPPVHREFSPGPGAYPPAPRHEDTYAGRFTAPLSVAPRSLPVKQKTFQPALIAAAAIAAVLLAALAAWWLWPAGDDEAVADAPSSPTPTVDAEGHDRLMGMLPPGYSEDDCTAGEAPAGAVAVVNCMENADAGGPSTATYTLMQDEDALNAALDKTIDEARVVNCPGRIQSPGPWRRNANPDKVAGTLVCGMPQKRALIAWTTESTLLLNVTRADPEGPTLDQLFTWWQSHS